MVRKHQVYTGALFGWLLVTLAGIVAVYSGIAEPYVSQPPPLFGSPSATAFALIVIGCASGVLVISQLRTLDWRSTGTGSDLTLESSGLLRNADLTGTVRGRSVRSSISRLNSPYTIVQADLSEPVEDGIIVGPADGGNVQRYEFGENPDVTDDQLAAVGEPEVAVQAVVSGRAREALLVVNLLNQVYVGDASDAFEDLEGLTSYTRYGSEYIDDASTVTHITKGEVFDADELNRQVEAVATVAEAFEDAIPAGQSGDEE